MSRLAVLCAAALGTAATLAGCGPAAGGKTTASAAAPTQNGLSLAIKDHKFMPAEIHVPAGKALQIEVANNDPLAEEFDSSDLKVEKVIAGGQTGTVHLRPLEPGRYAFEGEYHSTTAKGVVVAQ